ncbi:hypothetical protein [Mycolicibacterium tokaiense]|uniref:hypothetical protein n=1 Tax=Mycolicibacterium tokaiense TaxID=39695 RepID=UPI0021F3C588|nr:hypothetical protein [Mycolicibacterium tokaiense]
MKNLTAATLIGTALTAATLGLAAPALAAPTGAGNAQDTISSLQDQGYKVIVNRLEGPTFSHTNSNNRSEGGYAPNSDNQFAPVNTKTVYVNVR